jgi:hypothetical protein
MVVSIIIIFTIKMNAKKLLLAGHQSKFSQNKKYYVVNWDFLIMKWKRRKANKYQKMKEKDAMSPGGEGDHINEWRLGLRSAGGSDHTNG